MFVTLCGLAFALQIASCDMRLWRPGIKGDLVVSEMLGGFACNELSPECLEYSAHLFHGSASCS